MSDEQQPLRSQNVRELSFMGPSNDGTRLLLVGADGTQFELVVDSRLVSVILREHGPAPRPPSAVGTPAMPSPRDIQVRVRHGASIEEVAESAGVSVEDIAKFAYPVINERAHIAALARSTEVLVAGQSIALSDAVEDRVSTRSVDTRLIRWDAWRLDGHEWNVLVAYPAAQGERVASFTYNSATRTVTASDDEANWLLQVPEIQRPAAPTPPSGSSAGSSDTMPAAPSRPTAVPDLPPPPRDISSHVRHGSPTAESQLRSTRDSEPRDTPPSSAPTPSSVSAPPPGSPTSPDSRASSDSSAEHAPAPTRSWDRAHPAARAHQRREATSDRDAQAATGQPNGSDNRGGTGASGSTPAAGTLPSTQQPGGTHPAGTTDGGRREQLENQAPASPPAPPAPKKNETPQWEELLFGSPEFDDN